MKGSAIMERRSLGAPPVSKADLFEDDSSQSSDEDSADGGAQLRESVPVLKINEDFARRFDHNKKREEKHRLEEKYGSKPANGDDDSGSSSDETEDEAAFLLTEELDAQMSAALNAIKAKDPRIYDQNAKFYAEAEAEDARRAEAGEKKEKAVFLRDYHRERYMRGDVGAENQDDGPEKPKTYAQEQEDLKESFLAEVNGGAGDAAGEDSDEDGFLVKKEGPGRGGDDVHQSRAARIQLAELDVANADKDPELYLSNFMASKAWLPADGSRWQAFESDDEDDGANDVADNFEHAYNMRFEDPAKSNEVLKSYSRTVASTRSVRREEKKGRQRQRDVDKERKEAEKMERKEERARLRKLKVDEAHEKLKKIKQAAGMGGRTLNEEEWMKLLEDAWEDDKWEEEMGKQFGEQYYAENDDEAGPDLDGEGETTAKAKKKKPKKPKWDDDIDIKDLVPDFEAQEGAKPNITLTDSEADEAEGGDKDGGGDRPPKKRKTSKDHKKGRAEAKRAARIEHSKIEALVDTQMQLDSPAVLASSSRPDAAPALFRYRETSPNSFGLTAHDILMAPSDAALNEFVGLKKLAAFRDPDRKRKDKKRLGKKARLRQWRRDNFGAEFEHTGPAFDFDGARKAAPDEAADGLPNGGGDERKKKKRKRSQMKS